MTGVELMARAKQRAGKPVPKPADDRVAIIHLRGTPGYAEWLAAVHRRTHIPKATIVRLALAEWAGRHGHPTPPEF
jgi:hypothetical protein